MPLITDYDVVEAARRIAREEVPAVELILADRSWEIDVPSWERGLIAAAFVAGKHGLPVEYIAKLRDLSDRENGS